MRLYSTYRTNQTARVARSAALRADQSDQRTASEEQEGPYPPSSVSTNDSNVSTLYGAGSLGAISLGANAITWSSIVIASFEYVRDANQTGSEGKRVNHLHSLPVHIGADLSKAW